jgi:hypothetical protein
MATTSERTLRVSEREFLQRVRQVARLFHWVTYHTHRSDHSEKGFPDLCMVRESQGDRPARIAFAELKSARGRLTLEQTEWLRVLGQVPGIEVYCWKPTDWDQIVEALKRP